MSTTERIRWACPNCGAVAHRFGGFYCYCDGGTSDEHGETHEDPCLDAECTSCGWKGTFPVPPAKKTSGAER